MEIANQAAQDFKNKFGGTATSGAFAPGRVEVLGNHTDYNGGYVMPAALEQGITIVGRSVPGDKSSIYSTGMDSLADFDVTSLQKDTSNPWVNYVIGVIDQLKKSHVQIGAFEASIRSSVPTGAGLSSSAALEVAATFFLKSLFSFDLGNMQTALLCQRAENEFVGMNCGIMDQFSSVFGETDALLFLDCRTLEYQTVRMGRGDIAIVIANSGVKHQLTGGEYNARRQECMAASSHFGYELLRDLPWSTFADRQSELTPDQRKRARHVLSENARVLALREAIQGTDTGLIKSIIAAGHTSCRDLFENSTPEADTLVDIALDIPGCYGARMTGGGWAGATVNLVQSDSFDSFAEELALRYEKSFGVVPAITVSRAGLGARILERGEWE